MATTQANVLLIIIVFREREEKKKKKLEIDFLNGLFLLLVHNSRRLVLLGNKFIIK